MTDQTKESKLEKISRPTLFNGLKPVDNRLAILNRPLDPILQIVPILPHHLLLLCLLWRNLGVFGHLRRRHHKRVGDLFLGVDVLVLENVCRGEFGRLGGRLVLLCGLPVLWLSRVVVVLGRNRAVLALGRQRHSF